jgi:hypothetical protein
LSADAVEDSIVSATRRAIKRTEARGTATFILISSVLLVATTRHPASVGWRDASTAYSSGSYE